MLNSRVVDDCGQPGPPLTDSLREIGDLRGVGDVRHFRVHPGVALGHRLDALAMVSDDDHLVTTSVKGVREAGSDPGPTPGDQCHFLVGHHNSSPCGQTRRPDMSTAPTSGRSGQRLPVFVGERVLQLQR